MAGIPTLETMTSWYLPKTQDGTKPKNDILNHIIIYVRNQRILSPIVAIVVIITIRSWYFSFVCWILQESFNYTEVTGYVQINSLLNCYVIISVFFGRSRSDIISCTRCIGTIRRKWWLDFQKNIFSINGHYQCLSFGGFWYFSSS